MIGANIDVSFTLLIRYLYFNWTFTTVTKKALFVCYFSKHSVAVSLKVTSATKQ